MHRRHHASLTSACSAVIESLESRCLLSGSVGTLGPNRESIFRNTLEPGEHSAYRFQLNEPLVVTAKLCDAMGDARLRLVKPNGRVIRMDQTIRKALQPGKYRITVKNHNDTDVSYKLRLQAARGEQLDSPQRLTAHVYSGTDLSLDWVDQSNGERGFRIQQSVAGGKFQTIARVKGNVTKTYIDGLTPSTEYQFRVRAIGDPSMFSSDLEVSDRVLTSGENTTGWYKVTGLNYHGKGEAGYTASNNTLHVENDEWIYAYSWQGAVGQALSGGLKINDTDRVYTFANDGAFTIADAADLDATNSEFDISASAGKIVVLEDSYETTYIDRDYDDFYWKVSVEKLEFDKLYLKRDVESSDLFTEDGGGSIGSGDRYDFKVHLATPISSTDDIKWEVWDTDGIDTKLAIGDGTEFAYTLPSSASDYFVRFYGDNDDDDTWESGEPVIDTTFSSVEYTVHYITVAQPNTITAVSNSTIDAYLQEATDLISIRDSQADRRAAARFVRSGSISTWTVSSTAPDVITSLTDFDNLLANVNARVRIVRDYTYPSSNVIGLAYTNVSDSVTVEFGTDGRTWAHEIGHELGLVHRSDHADNLMNEIRGSSGIINDTERAAFE